MRNWSQRDPCLWAHTLESTHTCVHTHTLSFLEQSKGMNYLYKLSPTLTLIQSLVSVEIWVGPTKSKLCFTEEGNQMHGITDQMKAKHHFPAKCFQSQIVTPLKIVWRGSVSKVAGLSLKDGSLSFLQHEDGFLTLWSSRAFENKFWELSVYE